MIFRPELAAAILRGEKTVTRRRISANPRSPWCRSPLRYPVGMEFAIQPGRGKPSVARAVVRARYIETLSGFTPLDARREGFPTRDAFVEAWKAINGSWDPDEIVHVVRFKLAGPACPSCGGEGVQHGYATAKGPPGSMRGRAVPTQHPCFDCYGTGITVSPAGRSLVDRLELEAAGDRRCRSTLVPVDDTG